MIACILLLFWQYLSTSVAMATCFLFLSLEILWAFNIILKFQKMYITKGTRNLVLGNIWQYSLPALLLLVFTFYFVGS